MSVEQSPERARSGRRRGVRVVVVIATVVAMLAVVGTVARVLSPDPTGDPCATVPSASVDEFFADQGGSVAVRTTLPRSSTQRCLWLPRAGSDAEPSGRLDITFGLADRDEYLERMHGYADTRGATWEQRRADGNGEEGDGGRGSEGLETVLIDESTDDTAHVRLAAVQPGRTDGEHDIVLELSARAFASGATADELGALLSGLVGDLRPIRESVLRRTPGNGERMFSNPEAVHLPGQLEDDGFGQAGSAECARIPARVLTETLGKRQRIPSEAGCSWQTEDSAPSGDGDEGSSGDGASTGGERTSAMVNVRFGTADDPVTARDAYAELAFRSGRQGVMAVDPRHTGRVDLGDDVRARVLVGHVVSPRLAAVSSGTSAAVSAKRGRTVVSVHYWGSRTGPDGEPVPISPAVAERIALRVARATLAEL